jgi:serine/threonine protein kinase
MREVDVLKRLDHPGIVKYLSMQRKRDNLNIALECVPSLGLVRECCH